MIVTFISQCDKKAIKRTRQVLDTFANRIGDFAWQTVITADGLAMVKKLLAKTASKNTAVSCYRFHSRKHSELLWIIGNRNKFNEMGFVPVNTTQRNILHSEWQNDWQYINAIRIMATLAALLHDVGKSTLGFQHKLTHGSQLGDPYRHEWLSLKILLWLLQGCTDDKDWLDRFCQIHQWLDGKSIAELNQFLTNDNLDIAPLDSLPPLAQWLSWLIVSHHRLPPLTATFLTNDERNHILYPTKNNKSAVIARLERPTDKIYGELSAKDYWVKNPKTFDLGKNLQNFWQVDECVIFSPFWQKSLKRWANKAQQDAVLNHLSAKNHPIENPIFLYLSRLCLMVGDHNYSSLKDNDNRRVATQSSLNLLANTDRKHRKPKQFLDEHLVGVAKFTAHFAHHLPIIGEQLPTLSQHRPLSKNTAIERFVWQNHAFKIAKSLQKDSDTHGFFGINMASTGCGKTIGNARIMYALSDEKQGARFTIALGLRVLTLQTGVSLRNDLKLDENQLAILVGSGSARQLFDINQQMNVDFAEPSDKNQNDDHHAVVGSESADELINGWVDGDVDYHALDGLNIDTLLADPKAKTLLFSPVISCTIDHLIQACECRRGGGYIAPILRLLSSDLILDEPDDFDHNDLPALARLMYLAGLLGSKVLLSSATLPPDLLVGLFESYLSGRQLYNQSQNKPPPKVICAWFDEQKNNTKHQATDNLQDFSHAHQNFVAKRLNFLQQQSIRRYADILPVDLTYHQEKNFIFYQSLGQLIVNGAKTLHQQHHITEPSTQKSVSIGLVRIANIKELLRLASALNKAQIDDDTHLHIACYHSRQILLLRNRLEYALDKLLKRHPDNEQAIFTHPEIITAINQSSAKQHIFMVLATPVAEVGRDHDYDWAIVEPSSLRSIIQLAGRVWRHRPNKVATNPNLLILQYNIRYLKKRGMDLVFTKPGFEVKDYRLNCYDINQLIDSTTLQKIDASLRICQVTPKKPPENLAHLEHGLMKRLFHQPTTNAINAYWRKVAASNHLHSHLQQVSPFRHQTLPQSDWVIMSKQIHGEQGVDVYALEDIYRHGIAHASTHNKQIRWTDFEYHHPRISTWLVGDMYEELQRLQRYLPDSSLTYLATQFCQVSLDDSRYQTVWYFNPFLGVATERPND